MSFSDLLHMEKDELTDLLQRLHCSDLEIKTLLTAFNNLRACTGEKGQTGSVGKVAPLLFEVDLF